MQCRNDTMMFASTSAFLAAEELSELRRQVDDLEFYPAKVISKDGERVHDVVHRRCLQGHLKTDFARGIVDRMAGFVADANRRWGIEVEHMMDKEPWLIVCDYQEPGDYFNWHRDWCPVDENKTRKIGAVLQITDEREYEGCDLELFVGGPGAGVWSAPREAGSLTVFAGMVVHQVTPLVSGRRRSAMSFALGEASFR